MLTSFLFCLAATTAPASDTLVLRESTAAFSVKVQDKSTAWHKTADVQLENADTVAFRTWTLRFDYDGEILGVADRVQIRREGTQYTVTPKGTGLDYVIDPNENKLGMDYTFRVNFGRVGTPVLRNVVFETPARPAKVTEIQAWKLRATYAAGQMVHHQGTVYQCRQGHTVHAANWTPNLTPALWSLTKLSGTRLDVPFTR